MEIDVKGYCDNCDLEIDKIDSIYDDGNNIKVAFSCPGCNLNREITYEFMENEIVHG